MGNRRLALIVGASLCVSSTSLAQPAPGEIEMGVNSLSFSLVGLTLILYGVALAMSDVYPRWTGWLAVAAGIAHVIRGVGVSYQGFVPSIAALIGLALLALWTVVMAVLMWRQSNLQSLAVQHPISA